MTPKLTVCPPSSDDFRTSFGWSEDWETDGDEDETEDNDDDGKEVVSFFSGDSAK